MDVIHGTWSTKEVLINGRVLDPAKSWQVMDTGYAVTPPAFSWGEHAGSGLSQLALAILLEFTDADNAIRLYNNFKWTFMYMLVEGEDFDLSVDVRVWVEDIYMKTGGG